MFSHVDAFAEVDRGVSAAVFQKRTAHDAGRDARVHH
jgi:hypothetical protein